MGWFLALLALVPACRLDFDEHEPPFAATGTPLTCEPHGVQLGLSPVGMAAAATQDGLVVFAVDSNGIVRGWNYTVDSNGVTPTQENVVIGGADANGTIGVAVAGSTAIVAASLGKPTATSTALFALSTHDLSERAAPSTRPDELAATHPLASDGTTFAYATQTASKEADARFVAQNAIDASTPIKIADATDKASSVAIALGVNGYVMAYGMAPSGASTIQVMPLDATLAATGAPVHVDTDPAYGAYRPAITYAPHSGVYLVAYHIKNVTDDDDVWAELFDTALAPIGQPFKVATYSSEASVSTDGTDFWLVYRTYDPATSGAMPDKIAGSHVTASGSVTPVALAGVGGTLGKYASFERAKQSVVVWNQTGGSGPDLYVNPMCAN